MNFLSTSGTGLLTPNQAYGIAMIVMLGGALIWWKRSNDKLATIQADLAAKKAAIPGQVAAATAPKPDAAGNIAAGQLRDLVAGGPPHHHGHHGGGGRGRGGAGWGWGGWDGGGTTVVLAGSDWVWNPVSQSWVQRPMQVITSGQPVGAGPHMASQTANPPQATWNPPPAPRAQHPMMHASKRNPYRYPT